MNVLTVLCRDGWMPGNLAGGWRRLGWEVDEFYYGSEMGKDWSDAGLAANRETNEALLECASRLKSEGRLDLVFAVIYDDVLDVSTAKALRGLGVPLVNYHVDMVGQWYRVLKTAKYFDLVACAQHDYRERLEEAGATTYYMPMAANPSEDALSQSEEFDGVLYLGSPWLERRRVLGTLASQGVPLRIYGNNWRGAEAATHAREHPRKTVHDLRHYLLQRARAEGRAGIAEVAARRFGPGPVPDEAPLAIPREAVMGRYDDEAFAGLVRGAAVNLGFTHFAGAPGTARERRQVRLREFEIPMAGGFYLTQDCAQVRELFDVGTHLDVWDTTDDLAERVAFYRANRDAARRIADAGRAHCIARHTWERRFAGLLGALHLESRARVGATP